MSYVIPEEHQEKLRRLSCSFDANKVPQPLPEKLVTKYWEFKFCADRISMPLIDNDLVAIAVACGFGKPTAEQAAGPSLLTLWRQQKIQHDTPVTVKLAGKSVQGKLIRVCDDGRVIAFASGEEREFKMVDVSVAVGA